MNAKLGEDCLGLVCNLKSQYAFVKCVYKDCKYEHWFNYTKDGGKIKCLEYARSINASHGVSAHKGIKRDLK